MILGRPFAARVASPAVVEWLERYWLREDGAREPHPYRISFDETDALDDDPGSGWEPVDVRLPDGIVLHWERWGRAWRWRDGEAEVRVRLGDDGAGITFRASAMRVGEATSPRDFFPALYVAVSETLRASGLVPLHAAVVVRDGRATVLAAPSGTGKTTTLLRLLAHGWRPLAEDLSWLDPATGTLHGWDRGLRLWQDGLDRLGPELARLPWATDPDGKRFLSWDALGAGRVPRAKLARFALLERDAARPTSLQPLPPHDAMRTLWEATGIPLTPEARAVVGGCIANLVRRLDLLRLRLGGEREEGLLTAL